MARCSMFSWVWNSASPVSSSTSMQPRDQMSQGKDQPRPRMTSGALQGGGEVEVEAGGGCVRYARLRGERIVWGVHDKPEGKG
jgi:hypothetical protein